MKLGIAQLLVDNPVLLYLCDFAAIGLFLYLIMTVFSEIIASGIAKGLARSRHEEERLYKQRALDSLGKMGMEQSDSENSKKCSTMGFIADIDAPHS